MKFSSRFRKWFRVLHRELSFFFAGVIIIYAISGIVMNHKNTINPNFKITKTEYEVDFIFPIQDEIDNAFIVSSLLKPLNEQNNYTKHYFPEDNLLKVFLKGGSNLVVDINSRKGVYERVSQRPLLSALTKLHYNPGKWWTYFSDFFSVGLIAITLSGLFLVRGEKGLRGRGGILLVIGLLFPLFFLLFF